MGAMIRRICAWPVPPATSANRGPPRPWIRSRACPCPCFIPAGSIGRTFQVDPERATSAELDTDRKSHGGAFTSASGAADRGPGVVGQGPLSSAIIQSIALRGHEETHNITRMNRFGLFDHTRYGNNE